MEDVGFVAAVAVKLKPLFLLPDSILFKEVLPPFFAAAAAAAAVAGKGCVLWANVSCVGWES